MSDDATPRLALPYLAASQAQKHVTLNQALASLDGLVQTAVESRTLAAEPSAPLDGKIWMLPPSASGPDWSGASAGTLVRFEAGAWTSLPPITGQLVWVKDEGKLLVQTGAQWSEIGGGGGGGALAQNLPMLGIGTTADANTPFAARLNAALFASASSGAGGSGDVRLVVSKASPGNTASLLFQDNFSGRAEMGLAGDDQFHFKVSPDGANWREAILVDRTSGLVSFPSGASGQGLRNRLVNGGFGVWQRGPSLTCAAGLVSFTSDRWSVNPTGGACTASRQQSGLPAGVANALTVNASGALTALTLQQNLESAVIADLAGQTACLSFWLYASAACRPVISLLCFNSPDVANPATVGASIALGVTSPGWTRIVQPLTVPVGAINGVSLQIQFDAVGAGQTRGLAAVQFEAGSTASGFEVRPPQLELSLCQRYFYRAFQPPWMGIIRTATSLTRMSGQHPVIMRASPVLTLVGATPLWDGTASGSIASINTSYCTTQTVQFDATMATNMTIGRTCVITVGGASYADVNAEL